MEEQQDVSWSAQEIPVDDDKHDFLSKMSLAQRKLTDTTLQLFVEIEQRVGTVWEIIAKFFPHSEIEGACIEIARMEKSVHAFFYQKMSDVLNISPEDVAEHQQTIKVLREKLVLLESITTNMEVDKPLALFTVAAIEQVLLFSNFAMLKSFKANGNNLIKKTLTGVDYVIQDEQLHGDFAAYLHNTYIEELATSGIPSDYMYIHNLNCVNVIKEIIAHEDAVINYVYEGIDSINDITPEQLRIFIRSRANVLLTKMNFAPMYDIQSSEDKISQWFYKGIKAIKVHDFFAASTTQYRKNWKTTNFSRLPHMKGNHEQ
ncbi:MAG: ribonucleotide-diphosphate reductase subunit beta [Ignisphaera sp.]|nr:ribonucleotide-diphosphate reductase subunit beta [Ignisphaera sp.]